MKGRLELNLLFVCKKKTNTITVNEYQFGSQALTLCRTLSIMIVFLDIVQ